MSQESKKKRGESGKENAKNIPFRGHGRKPPRYHDDSIGRSDNPYGAGSRLVQAMMLAVCMPGFNPSDRLLAMTDKAMERMTHKLVM